MSTVEPKQAKNLFNTLIRDEKSVFYATDQLTKILIKKIQKIQLWKRRDLFEHLLKARRQKSSGWKIYFPLIEPFIEQSKDIHHF